MPSTNIKITATDKSKAAFTSAQRSVNALKGSIGLLKGALLGYISIAGAKTFLNFSQKIRDQADELGKMSKRLNMSTAELQKLTFAGELAGESQEAVTQNIIKFVKNIGDARKGISTMVREFDLLDISLKDQNGNWKSNSALLKEVGDKYASTTDSQLKLSSAMTLFGRGGKKMINMLQEGSGRIEQIGNVLEKLGGVMKTEVIQTSEDANDAWTILGKWWEGLSSKILPDMNKKIIESAEAVQKFEGVDHTVLMSFHRMNQRVKELDKEMIKAGRNRQFWNKNMNVTKEIRDMNVKAINKELFAMQLEQNLIQARISDSTKLTESKKKQQKESDKIKDKEVQNIFEISKAHQKMHSSSLTLAFDAHAKRNKITIEQTAKQKELHKQIVEFRNTEEQQITADIMTEHERRKEIINQYYGDIVANSAIKEQVLLQQSADTGRKLKALEIEKRDSAIDTSKEMIRSMGSANKSWFQANKALAVADTIMATYAGATKALAIPPPWVGIAYAATITGLGMANVNRIRNQKYEGRAKGGTVQSGRPYIVGEKGAEMFTPNQTGSITPNEQLGGKNVTFNILANDTRGFDQLLQQRRGMIVSMLNNHMNSNGLPSIETVGRMATSYAQR